MAPGAVNHVSRWWSHASVESLGRGHHYPLDDKREFCVGFNQETPSSNYANELCATGFTTPNTTGGVEDPTQAISHEQAYYLSSSAKTSPMIFVIL